MRVRRWIALPLLPFLQLVSGNTEKIIFIAPSSITIPNVHPGLDDLCIDNISPERSVLRTKLPVAFPSKESSRGIQSWYLLHQLRAGQRYEVRVCWVATQPTEFWLYKHEIAQVFETPDLITGLAAYSDSRPRIACPSDPSIDPSLKFTQTSALFLRIHSAADFVSTNKTLMRSPPLVGVDIILDPFIFNILPRSLAPTAVYIILIAFASWPLSGMLWTWLRGQANRADGKTHDD